MELYDVMRTTFAARHFTADPVRTRSCTGSSITRASRRAAAIARAGA